MRKQILIKIKRNFLYRKFIARLKVYRLNKFYKSRYPVPEDLLTCVIYMADGKMLHGGLSDRLNGLVSTYNYCKRYNKIFKAYFVSPYELSNFLLPVKYDWRIESDQISYNSKVSLPVYITYYTDQCKQRKVADKSLNVSYAQSHVYTNMRYFNEEFSVLFKELFRPSEQLQQLIKSNLEKIGAPFFSVTFRFQQLLGDFEEGKFPVIKEEEIREKLISDCLSIITSLHLESNYQKVLITSDSKTFLDRVKELKFVYVIPGDVVHVDFSSISNSHVHLKSFLDFFIISEAQKVYLVYSDLLYHSTFAKTAAQLNNRPYEEIKI